MSSSDLMINELKTKNIMIKNYFKPVWRKIYNLELC